MLAFWFSFPLFVLANTYILLSKRIFFSLQAYACTHIPTRVTDTFSVLSRDFCLTFDTLAQPMVCRYTHACKGRFLKALQPGLHTTVHAPWLPLRSNVLCRYTSPKFANSSKVPLENQWNITPLQRPLECCCSTLSRFPGADHQACVFFFLRPWPSNKPCSSRLKRNGLVGISKTALACLAKYLGLVFNHRRREIDPKVY